MIASALFLLFLTSTICAPIEDDDDPFELDFSHLGDQLYSKDERNYSVKLYEEWPAIEDGGSNPEELGPYVQGDLYQPVVPKNAVKFKSKLWKNAIVPYTISNSFGKSEVQMINNAIKLFRQKTCIRFVPRTTHKDYVAIESSSNGCWSTVGRVGGRQVLNLQHGGCFRRIGTILHELMHVIGFLHEHTRYDRDQFVNINFFNVRLDAISNFWKESKDKTRTYRISYDLGSVMHYSRNAFSWNGFHTVDPKVKFSGRIGQRDGFSNKDVKRITSMYCSSLFY